MFSLGAQFFGIVSVLIFLSPAGTRGQPKASEDSNKENDDDDSDDKEDQVPVTNSKAEPKAAVQPPAPTARRGGRAAAQKAAQALETKQVWPPTQFLFTFVCTFNYTLRAEIDGQISGS